MNEQERLRTLQEATDLRFARLVARARQGKILAFTLATKDDYQTNWHHKLTAQYINKFIRKEVRRLIILEPPRYGKSELSSRRLPALLHGIYPNDEVLLASYNADLANDMQIDVQRIMDTERYRNIFPYSRITPDGSKSQYARSRNEHELIPVEHNKDYWTPNCEMTFDGGDFKPIGSFHSAGVGGSFTGKGGKWIFIDDPVKNWEDADSAAFREMQWDWYRSTMRTRLEKDACILITMTHWHRDDLVGRLLDLQHNDPDADKWEVLKIPAIKEREHDPIMWEQDPHNTGDPRDKREIGDPLWPGKFTIEDLKATRASSGERIWSALYQQEPIATGGNIVKAAWFNERLMPTTEGIATQVQIISIDTASKDKTISDYYVYSLWGRHNANRFLLDQERGRWDFPTACRKLIEFCERHPRAGRKYIEAKANGPALFQTLKSKVTGLIEVEPIGDKVARLNAVTPELETNTYIPDPQFHPWVKAWLKEMTEFPYGSNDDQVDTASQALHILQTQGPTYAPTSGHGSGFIYESS